jgi:uncharacterized protein YkwD
MSESLARLVNLPRKNYIFALFAASFVLFATTPAAFAAKDGTSSVRNLLAAVNATRASYGLRPLHLDSTLESAARWHTIDMLRRNYFAHGNFAGRMAAFHVHGPTAGENLAWGSGPFGQAGTIVSEWLASPEHRANLLRPGYARIGIGLVRGSFLGTGGATVVTADFAGQ